MENNTRNIEYGEAGNVEGARDSRSALTELALTLYGCKDGSTVSRPQDCREGESSIRPSSLPDLRIG